MAKENKALEIMKKNLITYKDAVIILGNDIVKDSFLFVATENNKDTYSRKAAFKTPQAFWKLYKDFIAENDSNKTGTDAQKQVLKLLDSNIVNTVIDFNHDGYISDNISSDINYINVAGDRRYVRCGNCGELIKYNNFELSEDKKLMHKNIDPTVSCSGNITPTVPFYNSKIPKKTVEEINNAIFDNEDPKNPKIKTHALILIGVDMANDFVGEIVDSYCALRQDKTLTHLLMMITYHNPDLIEAYGAEFGTTDDIDKSINRLIELLKK